MKQRASNAYSAWTMSMWQKLLVKFPDGLVRLRFLESSHGQPSWLALRRQLLWAVPSAGRIRMNFVGQKSQEIRREHTSLNSPVNPRYIIHVSSAPCEDGTNTVSDLTLGNLACLKTKSRFRN